MIIVGHPTLLRWNDNAVIGLILKEIEREFLNRIPELLNKKREYDFAELKDMNVDEMSELLRDDVKLFYFLQKNEFIQNFNLEKKNLMKENETLAIENLEMRESIEILQNQVNLLQSEYDSIRLKYDIAFEHYSIESSKFKPDSLTHKLKESINDVESICEQMVDGYLSGGMDHVSFLKNYNEQRKLYHRRSILLEKWKAHNK